MLALLASLAFLQDTLAFPQITIFCKEYFLDRPQGLGLGQQQLLEKQPRNFFSLLVKDQFGKEHCLEKILQWDFKKIGLQRSA